MNKAELISAIAEKSGLSKKDSEKALNAFTDAVTDALKKNEKVQLIGFGTFETGVRAARDGVNPITKAKVHYDSKRVPKFKAGKALKDAVANA